MADGRRPELSRQQRRAQERAERKSMRKRASGALAVGAILAAGSASAATFTVSNLNDSGSGSLRDAVSQANSAAGGDTIVFQAGLTGTIILTTGTIPITDSVTINGPGAGVITVSGNNASEIFNVENTGSTTPIDVDINNLTLTAGFNATGGAIRDAGENLTLDHLTLSNNTGSAGGAVYFLGTNAATLTVTNSTITGNTGDFGGGIAAGGTGAVTITNTSFTSNTGNSVAGALYFYNQDAPISITGCTISGNTSPAGGGMAERYGKGAVTISNSNLTNNTASQYYGGAALFYRVYAPIALNNDTITGNNAGLVGGGITASIYTGNELDINNTLISGNTSGTVKNAPGYGGGIAVSSVGESGVSVLNVNDSIISGNVADPADAAVVTGTTTSDTGLGGGIYTRYASVYIRRTTINGNTANIGGGVYQYDGNVTLENVTITQNQASSSVATNPFGAGFYSYYGTTSIAESTITSNTTTYGGGGIDSYNGKITLTNSIVANNTGGATTPDVNPEGGATIAPNYTLIKTPGSATLTAGTGNLYNVDPNLGPLAANNSTIIAGATGTTQTVPTRMPECPSPVIDAGDPAFTPPPATDERGKPRVANARIDMGAVEVQPSTIAVLNTTQSVAENGGTVVVTVTRTSGDGPVDVSYATANGTATAGTDYQSASGTLHWNDGDTANKTVSITIFDDNVFEGNETFTFNLSAPTCSASLGAVTDTITIVDNESQPTLSINSVSQAEGNSGTTPFNFTVTLSGPSALTTTVQYATANGSAIAPGDYASASGTLTFNPGVTSQPVTINVVGDTACEPNETFTVNLSNPTNASILNGTGTGTIQNDDPCATDLGITKTASGSVFFATHPVTFNLAVTNNGPVAANAVVVTDTLPAGTTFNSATPSQGTCSGTTTVTCSLGSMGVGANATIALTLTPASPGPLQNTASVSAAPQTDSNPANDSSTANINVLPATDVPALSETWLAALGALLAAIGAWVVGKKG